MQASPQSGVPPEKVDGREERGSSTRTSTQPLGSEHLDAQTTLKTTKKMKEKKKKGQGRKPKEHVGQAILDCRLRPSCVTVST